MDAVKAFMERARMCNNYGHYGCEGCPLNRKCGRMIGTLKDAKEAVEIVEKWSKEHPLPLKTNGMVIMETLARMDVPCVGTAKNGLKQKMEIEIDAEWWDAEYKEGEK